jgi:ionotropic glutamate receptor
MQKTICIFIALDISNSQECDAIIAVIQPTPFRLRQLEFVHPWLYTPIAFIIPMPEVSQNNIDALIKPFQFWVCYFEHLKKISFFKILTFFVRFGWR